MGRIHINYIELALEQNVWSLGTLFIQNVFVSYNPLPLTQVCSNDMRYASWNQTNLLQLS